MDILLLISYIFILSIGIYVSYQYFENNGLFIFSILLFIASFLSLNQTIKISAINFNVSIVNIVALTTVEYIFILKESKKENKKYLYNYVIFNSIFILSLILTLLYSHSINDTFSKNFLLTFFNNKFIIILFPFFNILSIVLTYKIFDFIKKKESIFFNQVMITTIIVGIFDTICYFTIGNTFVTNFNNSLKIALGNYLIKIILTMFFIPFIYSISSKRKMIL